MPAVATEGTIPIENITSPPLGTEVQRVPKAGRSMAVRGGLYVVVRARSTSMGSGWAGEGRKRSGLGDKAVEH